MAVPRREGRGCTGLPPKNLISHPEMESEGGRYLVCDYRELK